MNFAEWRQRLRVVKAMPMLESGMKVETIALDLGYSNASAFISMFRRLMGVTPDEFRKGMGETQKPGAPTASNKSSRARSDKSADSSAAR
jgi:AraC-like DNA-binding protein